MSIAKFLFMTLTNALTLIRFQARFLQQPVRPSPQSQSLSLSYGSKLCWRGYEILTNTLSHNRLLPNAYVVGREGNVFYCYIKLFTNMY